MQRQDEYIRIVCYLVALFTIIYVSTRIVRPKRVTVKCPDDNCSHRAKGYDIEAVYDEEDQPVWAVSYECPGGHRFVAEYERDCEIEHLDPAMEGQVPEK